MEKSNPNIQDIGFRYPEFRLLLVILFMLWSGGILDILNAIRLLEGSASPTFIAFASFNILVLVFWITLFFNVRLIERAMKIIAQVQERTWLFLLVIGSMTAAAWLLWSLSSRIFLILRLCWIAILLILAVNLVFSGRDKLTASSPLRKGLGYVLVAIFGLELVLQLLALMAFLPGYPLFLSGMYIPYGRVYQTNENLTNGITNRYGFWYPDFAPEEDARRIVLLGDDFLQALQVLPEENMGYILQELLLENNSEPIQVFALGYPGFGPGTYMMDLFLITIIEQFNPDEIVFFVHTGNDFQRLTDVNNEKFFFLQGEDGTIESHPDAVTLRHDLQHVVIRGYFETWDPRDTIKTYVLAPRFIQSILMNGEMVAEIPLSGMDFPATTTNILAGDIDAEGHYKNIIATSITSAPGTSNFLFETPENGRARQAIDITLGLLSHSIEYLNEMGIPQKVVTIPVFPEGFYESGLTAGWSGSFEDYDLLQTEKALIEFAQDNDLPILPMGHLMQENYSANELGKFYFPGPIAHLTSEGHQLFGQAMLECLYSLDPATYCQP